LTSDPRRHRSLRPEIGERPEWAWIPGWVGVVNMLSTYGADHTRLRGLVAPSAGSRGKPNRMFASGVSASPLPVYARRTGRPSRSATACVICLGTGHFGVIPRRHQSATEVHGSI